jgi:hypothetical protein
MGERTIEVRGLTIHIDTAAFEDWSAMGALMALTDEGANPMQKLQASFDFIEAVTDVSQEDIIEACGGKSAKTCDVISMVAEIIQKSAPKN